MNAAYNIISAVSDSSQFFNNSKCLYRAVFLNRRAADRYRAQASIIPARERFSWNLSF